MKRKVAAWLALGIITLVAGLLLASANELTKNIIVAQNEQAAQAARQRLLPAATEFVAQEDASGTLDNLFTAKAGDETVGSVAQITTQGFGGPIEIIVGMDAQGAITGISVGGASFKETAGLGAKTKDGKFTDQFAGKQAPLALGTDIDAVTAATISSRAVTEAVNRAVEVMYAKRIE